MINHHLELLLYLLLLSVSEDPIVGDLRLLILLHYDVGHKSLNPLLPPEDHEQLDELVGIIASCEQSEGHVVILQVQEI